MKKFLFGLLLAVLAIGFTGCNVQYGLAYNARFAGDGDGKFQVGFPHGSYAMDGKASLELVVGDTILFNEPVTTKSEVLERGNKKELAALQRANDSIATQFTTFIGEGTYDLWLKGFVKEIGTGLVFEIDRHFTNRTDTTALRKAPAIENEFCPYIK